MTFKEIKNQAFSLFKESFGKCTAASLTVMFIKIAVMLIIMTLQLVSMKIFGVQCITGYTSILFYVLYLLAYIFIFMPLEFSKSLFELKTAKGEKPDTDSIFDCFKSNYFYSVCIQLRQALAKLMAFLFIVIVCASVYTFGVNIIYIIEAGILAWILMHVIMKLRYSSLMNAAVLCSMQGINKTMRKAVRTSRKNKHIVFCLLCTLAGWILLSLVTCGIGFIFVGSYISICIKKYYLTIERGF